MPKHQSSRGLSGGPSPSGAKGGLGQHFLKNPLVVKGIVDKSNINQNDTVLEIGPGTGNMTVQLLEKAKKVSAIELDHRMVTELKKRVQNTEHEKKLEIIQGDCLKLDWPFANLLVANIPYQISSPIIFKLLAHKPKLKYAVIMVQEEFAQRLIAKPGEKSYCRLSVDVKLLADVKHIMKVGRNNFNPPPKVDSVVIKIEPKITIPPINFNEWDNLLRICFTRKNKTLRASLTTKPAIKIFEMNFENFITKSSSSPSISSLSEIANLLQSSSISTPNKDDISSFVSKEDDISKIDIKDDIVINPKQSKIKSLVESVLNETNLSDKRSSKLDVDDFILLLSAMNRKGMHFNSS